MSGNPGQNWIPGQGWKGPGNKFHALIYNIAGIFLFLEID